MTKEEFLELVAQWSMETCFLSWHDTKHPAYLTLLEAGPSIIPWLLERLQDSIGHDHGDDYDHTNSPWLSTCLLGDLTKGTAFMDFPEEYAGNLIEIRKHLLKWGRCQGHIKS